MRTWDELYEAALTKLNPRTVSPFIEAGGVAAAIGTEKGSIYCGVCMDTACSLGMCAERAAIAAMITAGESRIRRIVCLMGNRKPGMPCGACRELMMQLDGESGSIEILTEYPEVRIITLKELVPAWWGRERFNDK